MACDIYIARPDNVGRQAKILVSTLYSIQLILFFFLRKHLFIDQCSLFIFFLLFIGPLHIGKHRMNPVSFVYTTESHEISLVTINRQTSYDSVIRNHTRFADEYEACRFGHHLGSKFIRTDPNERA